MKKLKLKKMWSEFVYTYDKQGLSGSSAFERDSWLWISKCLDEAYQLGREEAVLKVRMGMPELCEKCEPIFVKKTAEELKHK